MESYVERYWREKQEAEAEKQQAEAEKQEAETVLQEAEGGLKHGKTERKQRQKAKTPQYRK